MSFSEHKITNFTHRISDLPDQPDLSPADLKARFDSAPEQLRQAHNAVCDDAARLDERVSGIVAETFGDAIPKTMLTEELQSEIDGKAEQTALTAETAARETLAATVAQKCECYFGTYTGDSAENRIIELGFTPKAVLIFRFSGLWEYAGYRYAGVAFDDHPAGSSIAYITIIENGIQLYHNKNDGMYVNLLNTAYALIAFR